ncbi:UV-damaged DNA-binding protein rad7 [Coemansia biformis]|uniref:UV-damaged DNA-binding protein rad7 n=1 Tax=Coemansia biformis TaxID=1286918 RepID=A0A9W7YE76_9FUNG|nr:UV-damaged DNA-binding protein rad7 [Coemansia biformis]
MDPNDRARRSASGRGAAGAQMASTTIRGPHSALTDYLQEIGVTEHFRERRQREAAERVRARAQQQEQEQQAREQQAQAQAQEQPLESGAAGDDAPSADAALAADMQQEEEAATEAGASTSAAAAEAVMEVAMTRKGAKRGAKKGKGKRDAGDEDPDDAAYGEGLNRGSARKGGRMKECEMCGKTFLLRGEPTERLLCAPCRRSVDKAAAAKTAVSKRARAAAPTLPPPKPKRRRAKKTEGGLLELDPGLPSLQDLCARAIAHHVDRVESFGAISAQSLNKICRIICKMRLLDEKTLPLFVSADRASVTLYDCTRITGQGIDRIIAACPSLETLHLEFCGRVDGDGLLALARGLPRLANVRLDGAFLVQDDTWAEFFREMGPRLREFKVAYAGMGPRAMRALVTHCTELAELRVVECSDFDDDCLAMLAAPITEHEEAQQEAERLLRAQRARACKGKMAEGAAEAAPPWQRLARLVSLELPRPHKPMTSATAARVVYTLGAQLGVLDLTGFRDLGDGFLLAALAEHGGDLWELGLGECNELSPDAFAEFFARGSVDGARPAGHGLLRVDLGRCYGLTDGVVKALVRHSRSTLRHVCLNSVDDSLTADGVLALGDAPGLEELDLSWVRCTTDAVLEQLVPRCPRLAVVRVYGCPGVTPFAPKRAGLTYVGREADTL